MTEIDDTNLLARINPISDPDAGAVLSAERHRWFQDQVMNAPTGPVPHAVSARRLPPRRMLLAGTLVAIVVALIVLIPGLLSNDGSVTAPPSADAQILHRVSAALTRGPQTILIQRSRLVITSQPVNGSAPPKLGFGPVNSLTIDESSPNGTVERSFSTSSDLRPGFQALSAGNTLQIYDPNDDTIYATTTAAWAAAVQRQFTHPPLGGGGGSTVSFSSSGRDSTGPGNLSVFAQRVRKGLYRVAGTTTIDGQRAVKLTPVRASIPVKSSGNGTAREDLGTVYVSPRTYYPIREVTPVPASGSPLGTPPSVTDTVTNDWSEYTVVPATAQTNRLVSLRARHPDARIVHSATAYLRIDRVAAHTS